MTEPQPLPDVREKVAARRKPKAGASASAASAAHEEAPPFDESPPFEEPIKYQPEPPLKAGCPISVLGKLDGYFHILSNKKELRRVDEKFGKGTLLELFGTQSGWMDANYPQWVVVKDDFDKPIRGPDGKKVYEKKGYNQADVQRALIVEADRQGVFSPADVVRGRGAWRGHDGELILHCGDILYRTQGQGVTGGNAGIGEDQPGFLSGYVYPGRPKQPRPDTEAASIEECKAVLETMGSWKWERPEIAPLINFAFIPLALMGGALDFRPHIWLTGPSGCGKSALQTYMREILFGQGLFISKGTEAGVRQRLVLDCLPVMFDEPETGSSQDTNIAKIIELARISSTGDKDVMGSQDHTSREFMLRSTFYFSSKIHAKLEEQDRNRMAILNLKKMPAESKFKMPNKLRETGRRMRRRIMEQWHRWDETLLVYQAALLHAGCVGRDQDVYGTFLAAADLMLADAAPAHGEARVMDAIGRLEGLITVAKADREDQSEICLSWLTSFRLPSAGGKDAETVASWVRKAVIETLGATVENSASRKLLTFGLRIVHFQEIADPKDASQIAYSAIRAMPGHYDDSAPSVYLAVAGPTHQGTRDVFANSPSFKGGGWMQALDGVKGAVKRAALRVAFEGSTKPTVLLPIAAVIDLKEARLEALGEVERKRLEREEAIASAAAKARPRDPKEAAKHDEYQAQLKAQRDAQDDDAAHGGLDDWK